MLQLITIYHLRGILREYDENKSLYERYIFPVTHLLWEPNEIQSFRRLVTQVKERIGGPDFDGFLNDEEQFELIKAMLKIQDLQDANNFYDQLLFRLKTIITHSQIDLFLTLRNADLLNVNNLKLLADSNTIQQQAEIHSLRKLNYEPKEKNEIDLMSRACSSVAHKKLLNQSVFESLLKKIKRESLTWSDLKLYTDQIILRSKFIFQTSMQSLKNACLFSIFHDPKVNAAVLTRLSHLDCPQAREMMEEYQNTFRLT